MSLAFRRMLAVALGAALLMGLTAAPLSAAKPDKKLYTLNVSSVPAEVTNGATVDFSATLKNTSPDGISSFNSLTLTIPTGFEFSLSNVDLWLVIPDVPDVQILDAAVALDPVNLQKVVVTGLSPVGPGEAVKVVIGDAFVDVPANATCTDVTLTWSSEAWTGSNTSGNQFILDTRFSSIRTTVGGYLPAGGTATAGGGTVTAQNLSGTCVGVTLTRDGNTVWLLKGAVDAQFRIEINAWDPEAAVAPIPEVRWTEVDTPGGFHDIQWCEGTPSAPSPPGDEISCLISQSSVTYGPDGDGGQLIQVSEAIYLDGDWGVKRG